MKEFRDKFETIMETVEMNLKEGSALAVQDEAGKKIGEPGRKVGDAFSFITNMTVKSYMTRRKYDEAMRKALSTIGEKSHIEKAAAEFGYYDRSNFDNEVERLFGAKPAAYTSGKVEFKGMQRLKFEDITGMQTIIEDNIPERVTEIIVIDVTAMQNELINDRLDCQAAYGVDFNLLGIIQEYMEDYSRERLAEVCETIDGEKAEALVILADVLDDLQIDLNSLITDHPKLSFPSNEEIEMERNMIREYVSETEDRIGELREEIYNIATGNLDIVEVRERVDYWQDMVLSYHETEEWD